MPSGPYAKSKRVPTRPLCKNFSQTGACKSVRCPFSHEKQKGTGGVLMVMLKLLFEKQHTNLFDPETGMLHLTRLAACPDVEEVKSAIDFNTQAFCTTLVAVIKDVLRPPPSFYVLDDNSISHVQHFLKALVAHELHAGVRGLSFAGNQVKNLEFLQSLTPFEGLQELVFVGNPVASLPDYRPAIRKKFPELLGLDHAGINRPPLSLPWPVPPAFAEDEQAVLQWVETEFFAAIEAHGANALARVYHADAVFSLTIDPKAAISAPKPSGEVRREVVREFVVLQSKLSARSRNCIMKASGSARVAVGVAEVLTAVAECLYPSSMQVHHQLEGRAASVFTTTGAGGTVPLAIVTVHGRIGWVHKTDASSHPVTRRFSRTLALTQSMGAWMLANDQMTITPDADDVVFIGGSAARVEQLARKWNIAHRMDFFEGIVAACTNDWDVKASLDDLRHAPEPALAEAMECANGDAIVAVKVARVMAKVGCPASGAAGLLEASAGDVSMAIAAASPETAAS